MAHPITRTPWIDDDGTGTTGTIINNAEKQALYNQIDAAIVPEYGGWVPQDMSGAGLVFAGGTTGWYAKYGRIAFVWLQIVFPSTASGAAAQIGNFPYVVRSGAGMSQGYGPGRIWYLPINGNETQPYDITTGAPLTNAQLSGSNNILSAVYVTD